jgi:hypothetical protein
MKPHVKIIDTVPAQLFINAKNEVLNIDWNDLPIPDRRGEAAVFATSITNHLRVHKAPWGTPHTVEALSVYVDCMDTRARAMYPAVGDLINWIYDRVNGSRLGRIMLVKLLPGGKIGEHIDPGPYFQAHYRFHVPFITHRDMVFFGPGLSNPTHMPEGMLCQLANRDLHAAENNSNVERIHLIVDIDSTDSSYALF